MNPLIIAALLALAPGAQETHHDHGPSPQLGKLSFETSCNPAAQMLVTRGLGWLHSFEYEEAARTFSQAFATDPECAIAQWGVAMTYYHPLWAPPNVAERAKASEALAKARAARTASARERDYIAALDTFYRDSDRVDHKTRTHAYVEAMQQIHARYPADDDAAVFYALALVSAGTMDSDPGFAKERQAGAILNRVLAQTPDHPGVAHYLIHSFDYPALADLALPAARRYASIAPASPHAQHMPSHIFVRLGLWDEAISSNVASEAAARAFAKAQGLPDASSERLHAMDYLAYGYLQTGQDRKAEEVRTNLYAIRRADPPILAVAYAATAIPARIVLERREWKKAASLSLPDNVRALVPLKDFGWSEAHIHFARAIGAVRGGDVAAARSEVAALSQIENEIQVPSGTYDWRTQVSIERQVAAAWLAHAEGRQEQAITMMRAAADLDDVTEKHPATPGALLPAREQLGELLLELGRPAQALREYEAALQRAPRRLGGLYGAARAAKLAGLAPKAQAHFAQVLEITKQGDRNRIEIKEAQAFTQRRARR